MLGSAHLAERHSAASVFLTSSGACVCVECLIRTVADEALGIRRVAAVEEVLGIAEADQRMAWQLATCRAPGGGRALALPDTLAAALGRCESEEEEMCLTRLALVLARADCSARDALAACIATRASDGASGASAARAAPLLRALSRLCSAFASPLLGPNPRLLLESVGHALAYDSRCDCVCASLQWLAAACGREGQGGAALHGAYPELAEALVPRISAAMARMGDAASLPGLTALLALSNAGLSYSFAASPPILGALRPALLCGDAATRRAAAALAAALCASAAPCARSASLALSAELPEHLFESLRAPEADTRLSSLQALFSLAQSHTAGPPLARLLGIGAAPVAALLRRAAAEADAVEAAAAARALAAALRFDPGPSLARGRAAALAAALADVIPAEAAEAGGAGAPQPATGAQAEAAGAACDALAGLAGWAGWAGEAGGPFATAAARAAAALRHAGSERDARALCGPACRLFAALFAAGGGPADRIGPGAELEAEELLAAADAHLFPAALELGGPEAAAVHVAAAAALRCAALAPALRAALAAKLLAAGGCGACLAAAAAGGGAREAAAMLAAALFAHAALGGGARPEALLGGAAEAEVAAALERGLVREGSFAEAAAAAAAAAAGGAPPPPELGSRAALLLLHCCLGEEEGAEEAGAAAAEAACAAERLSPPALLRWLDCAARLDAADGPWAYLLLSLRARCCDAATRADAAPPSAGDASLLAALSRLPPGPFAPASARWLLSRGGAALRQRWMGAWLALPPGPAALAQIARSHAGAAAAVAEQVAVAGAPGASPAAAAAALLCLAGAAGGGGAGLAAALSSAAARAALGQSLARMLTTAELGHWADEELGCALLDALAALRSAWPHPPPLGPALDWGHAGCSAALLLARLGGEEEARAMALLMPSCRLLVASLAGAEGAAVAAEPAALAAPSALLRPGAFPAARLAAAAACIALAASGGAAAAARLAPLAPRLAASAMRAGGAGAAEERVGYGSLMALCAMLEADGGAGWGEAGFDAALRAALCRAAPAPGQPPAAAAAAHRLIALLAAARPRLLCAEPGAALLVRSLAAVAVAGGAVRAPEAAAAACDACGALACLLAAASSAGAAAHGRRAIRAAARERGTELGEAARRLVREGRCAAAPRAPAALLAELAAIQTGAGAVAEGAPAELSEGEGQDAAAAEAGAGAGEEKEGIPLPPWPAPPLRMWAEAEPADAAME